MEKMLSCAFRKKILSEKGMSVVLFFSTTCHNCNAIKHILKRVEKSFASVDFFEIDLIDNMDLAQQYSVTIIPTVIFFENGIVKGVVSGLKKESSYYDKVNMLFYNER